jgi:hypothetical protein
MSFEFPVEWLSVNISDLSSTILGIASLALSIYATALVLRYRREFSLPEQVSNVPELLNKEYGYREFSESIEFKDPMPKTMMDARTIIRRKEEANMLEQTSFCKEGTLENEFAYQISIALQNVGMMVLSGAIPIKLVLPNIGKMIVEDWIRCYPLVEKIRKKEIEMKNKNSSDFSISFSRRHAEWLAFSSAIYLSRYWKGKDLDDLLKKFMSLYKIDLEKMKKTEKQLRESESRIITSRNTSNEIKKFLYDCNFLKKFHIPL